MMGLFTWIFVKTVGGISLWKTPRAKTKIEMPAHTSKEFVSVWEDQIRNVEINTMVWGIFRI